MLTSGECRGVLRGNTRVRIALPDRARWIAAALLIVLLVPIMPAHSRAAMLFTVSTTNDSGNGSLHDAISHANAAPGSTIAFAIPGASIQTITLTAALPNIAADVVIDATTQPGYSGTPLIVIDGNNSVTDITVNNGANARLRGLNITRGHGSTWRRRAQQRNVDARSEQRHE